MPPLDRPTLYCAVFLCCYAYYTQFVCLGTLLEDTQAGRYACHRQITAYLTSGNNKRPCHVSWWTCKGWPDCKKWFLCLLLCADLERNQNPRSPRTKQQRQQRGSKAFLIYFSISPSIQHSTVATTPSWFMPCNISCLPFRFG